MYLQTHDDTHIKDSTRTFLVKPRWCKPYLVKSSPNVTKLAVQHTTDLAYLHTPVLDEIADKVKEVGK